MFSMSFPACLFSYIKLVSMLSWHSSNVYLRLIGIIIYYNIYYMQYNIFKLVCFYTISMLAGSLGIHLKCTCSYWTRGTFALQVVPKQKSCSELIYCKSKIYCCWMTTRLWSGYQHCQVGIREVFMLFTLCWDGLTAGFQLIACQYLTNLPAC